ncbi:uncharacterized protein LOC136088420 [Hydra vulgaris]|uniref:Uncharacterized protein LOC136088420 n=1 Tax=Hydra vulgaris TaxID=6087 RepID=A0ABM4D1T2_HYDVU
MATYNLDQTSFPLYSLQSINDELFITCGSGGAAKTGVKNSINIYKLQREFKALLIHEESCGSRAPMNLCLNSNRNLVAVGMDHLCQIYSLKKDKEKIFMKEKIVVKTVEETNGDDGDYQTSVSFTLDGKHIITGSSSGSCKVFECPSFQLKFNIKKAPLNEIDDLDVHPNSKYFVSVSKDHSANLWKWLMEPPTLTNKIPSYLISEDVKSEYAIKISEWIVQGWLKPFEGRCDGIIPLMAVTQRNKVKIRPVMDYRELNQFVSSHTADGDVCSTKLRNWRKLGENLEIIDLKKAYLQIRVDEALWKYQVVEYEGQRYCLTRLGFGLNVAPRIMTKILKKVLSLNKFVESGTDSFIDDIIVNNNIVSSCRVQELLKKYGLDSKLPEKLVGGRVLGLRVYLKRVSSSCGWDSLVKERVVKLVSSLNERLTKKDPVHGSWNVKKISEATVWCDASSLAVGIVLKVAGKVVEDCSWLRKQDDTAHINLAELEAVIKGINLATKWGFECINIKCDSATVVGWLSSLINGDKPVRVHGLGEPLVRLRLSLIEDLVKECNIKLKLFLVKSAENKADALTRVPQNWLHSNHSAMTTNIVPPDVKSFHNLHHFRVNRTLYLMKQTYPKEKVCRKDVESVVKSCERCLLVDLAPIRWEEGNLEVGKSWQCLAIDINHYKLEIYLSIIDCGKRSKFAIWRRLQNEKETTVCFHLEEIFRERGPPWQVLLDNSKTFRSKLVGELCAEWGVSILFRCAYRPSGNGIVERHHRTIKRMAARSGKWYIGIT